MKTLALLSCLVSIPMAALHGQARAQNLIQGAEVSLSPFASGSNSVSAKPVSLTSTAQDQQGPGSAVGTRQASGEANNLTGVMRASAGFIGVCCGFSPSASAGVAIGGIITPIPPSTVPFGTVELVTFSLDFHGIFDPNGYHEIDVLNGSLQLIRVVDSVPVPYFDPPYGILRPSFTFQGNSASVATYPNVGGNPAYEKFQVFDASPNDLRARVYFTIPFVVGESFRVTAQLSASSSLDPVVTDSTGSFGAVAASDTGILSVTLPDGFSFASPDGLLSQVTPLTAVPEASTPAMLGLALLALGCRLLASRRRGKRSDPR